MRAILILALQSAAMPTALKMVSSALTVKNIFLKKNKVTDHLHGGDNGFDKKIWTINSSSEKTLSLKYKSMDGEEGYPGNLETELRF